MTDLGTIELIRGEDFALTVYLGTKKKIESSTSANPSVITITNHGYSNSTKKQIKDHVGNTVINNTTDNPFHTITTIDANTFSVPVDGTTNGGMTGTCLTPTDLTGLSAVTNVISIWRSSPIKTTTTPTGGVSFTPTLAITTAAEGTVTITVDKSLTYSDAVGGLTLNKYYGDILVKTAGGLEKYYVKFVIDVKDSSSRI